MSNPSPLIGSLCEIILYVSDMNSQVGFYRDTLGLTISYPGDLADYSDQFWVTFETGSCVLALHGGGEKDFGKSAPKFVFHSDQIEAAREHLREQKVPVSEIDSPAPGVQVFNAKDPEGNLFSVECR